MEGLFKMKKHWQLLFALLPFFFILSGCTNSFTENDHSETIAFKKDDANQLEVDLQIENGKMNIASTKENWVDGQIQYNNDKLEPTISYDLEKQTGKVHMSQSDTNLKVEKIKNNWDINLTEDVPIELSLETGVADATIDLRDIQVEILNVEAGVGRTTIDLSGDWSQDMEAKIDLGVGQSTITLPNDVGVEVLSKKGIGSANFEGLKKQNDNVYVNDAYDESEVTLTIQVDIGIGEANFKVEN